MKTFKDFKKLLVSESEINAISFSVQDKGELSDTISRFAEQKYLNLVSEQGGNLITSFTQGVRR